MITDGDGPGGDEERIDAMAEKVFVEAGRGTRGGKGNPTFLINRFLQQVSAF